jgi:uncharacterized membrane protein YgcG
MILWQRAFAVLLAGAAVAVSVPLGCRNVIGITSLGDDALTCDAYCDLMATACTGDKLQYVSREACIGLCATFPVGTLDDTLKNTLGCRIRQASALASTGEGSCTGAGPGGDTFCGSNCEGFCTEALAACPQDFKTLAACQTACQPLADCGNYFVVPDVLPDFNTIQCRLYHVTAASIDPTDHCLHVLGEGGFCTPTSPGCSSTSSSGSSGSSSSSGGTGGSTSAGSGSSSSG